MSNSLKDSKELIGIENKNAKFCGECGKALINHTFEPTRILYDTQTGNPYRVIQKILVCPDHADDYFPTNPRHTRILLEKIHIEVEENA
jgi:hypothetical protein